MLKQDAFVDTDAASGEIYRSLAAGGRLIGTNDLGIATTALANGTGVVSNNIEGFERVPGRVVIGY